MPVIRERDDLAEAKTAQDMRDLKQLIREVHGPGGNRNVFDVFIPEGHEYKLVWADPQKVDRKRSQFKAEIVDAKTAKETYLLPDQDINKTDNCARRLGMILMRYPARAALARQALGPVRHMEAIDSELREFMGQEGAEEFADGVLLEAAATGRRPPRGITAPAARPQRTVRPRTPVLDHALEAQGLSRDDIDDGEEE